MSDSPGNTDAAGEVKQPAKRLRVVKNGAVPASGPKPVVLELLTECDEHKTADDKPMLVFRDGQKPAEVIAEAIQVVVAENNAKLKTGGFHRDLVFRNGKGGGFVTLAKDDEGRVVIKPLSKANISLALQARFCYVKGNPKKKEGHRTNPTWLADGLTYADNEYKFPLLNGLLQVPAIHIDGTIVTREGYDDVTGTWVVAGWEKTKVPAKPTAAQVTKAVVTLREPFAEVIFKGDKVVGQSPVKESGVEMTPSEANVIGMILTGFMRKQMQLSPFFTITSHRWGTAKGLVAQIVAHIVGADDPATMQGQKKSAYMTEANMDRFLLDHPDELFVQLDETSGRWHTDQMALIATTDKYINRAVYGQTAARADVRRVFTVTGRNLRPDKDMTRRVSMIELHHPADGTKPEERTFKHKDRANKALLLRWVDANRPRFIESVLTLVNAWVAADRPSADFNFDFPDWVDVVGGIMKVAGVKAWMTNRKDVSVNADEAQRARFVLAIIDKVGLGTNWTTREVVQKVKDDDNIRDLLTWDDTWAQKLFQTWENEDMATYNLSRLLGSVHGELMTDPLSGESVTVESYEGKVIDTLPDGTKKPRKRLKWRFTKVG